MTIKEAFTTWLKSRAPLVALLYDTAAADVRVYPLRKPQGAAFPQLTWWITGRTRYKGLGGPIGITTVKIRLDCRGLTLADADAVANALRVPADQGGLDGYQGDMAGIRCQALLVEDGGDGSDNEDDPVHGGEAGTALVSLDASLTFEEP